MGKSEKDAKKKTKLNLSLNKVKKVLTIFNLSDQFTKRPDFRTAWQKWGAGLKLTGKVIYGLAATAAGSATIVGTLKEEIGNGLSGGLKIFSDFTKDLDLIQSECTGIYDNIKDTVEDMDSSPEDSKQEDDKTSATTPTPQSPSLTKEGWFKRARKCFSSPAKCLNEVCDKIGQKMATMTDQLDDFERFQIEVLKELLDQIVMHGKTIFQGHNMLYNKKDGNPKLYVKRFTFVARRTKGDEGQLKIENEKFHYYDIRHHKFTEDQVNTLFSTSDSDATDCVFGVVQSKKMKTLTEIRKRLGLQDFDIRVFHVAGNTENLLTQKSTEKEFLAENTILFNHYKNAKSRTHGKADPCDDKPIFRQKHDVSMKIQYIEKDILCSNVVGKHVTRIQALCDMQTTIKSLRADVKRLSDSKHWLKDMLTKIIEAGRSPSNTTPADQASEICSKYDRLVRGEAR